MSPLRTDLILAVPRLGRMVTGDILPAAGGVVVVVMVFVDEKNERYNFPLPLEMERESLSNLFLMIRCDCPGLRRRCDCEVVDCGAQGVCLLA